MLLISHRGNLSGPNSCKENHPDSIMKAIQSGFDCEIDVRKIGNRFYLGHDLPEYLVPKDFLNNPYLWVHCKNLSALHDLIELDTNVFFHNTDDYTLTSKNVIWTYPGKPTNDKCVIVSDYDESISGVYGICSDYVLDYSIL
jgi:hypothetical protein